MAALRVRVLCDGCEAAQASHWCIAERRSLCSTCASGTRGSRVALPQPAAVLPLCHACRKRPATRKSQIEALTLCQECRVKCLRAGAKYRSHARATRAGSSGSGGSSSDDNHDHHSNASFSRESSTE